MDQGRKIRVENSKTFFEEKKMEQIKILGISGSPRKGNTEILVKLALEAAEENGNVSTEFISLREKPVKPCIADYACTKKGTLKKPCPTIDDDFGNEIMAKMVNADGFIIGCPVYFGGVTAQLKPYNRQWLRLLEIHVKR